MTQQSEPPAGDAPAFIDQARWLIDSHDSQGQAFASRATALLGFNGVILTLLLAAAAIPGIEMTGNMQCYLRAVIVLVLLSAVLCIRVYLPGKVRMPGSNQLRSWWGRHMDDPAPGTGLVNIAESLLYGADVSRPAPITDAVDLASRRAFRFKLAAGVLVLALLPLGLLVDSVLGQAWGR